VHFFCRAWCLNFLFHLFALRARHFVELDDALKVQTSLHGCGRVKHLPKMFSNPPNWTFAQLLK